jgi:hypothetical protein
MSAVIPVIAPQVSANITTKPWFSRADKLYRLSGVLRARRLVRDRRRRISPGNALDLDHRSGASRHIPSLPTYGRRARRPLFRAVWQHDMPLNGTIYKVPCQNGIDKLCSVRNISEAFGTTCQFTARMSWSKRGRAMDLTGGIALKSGAGAFATPAMPQTSLEAAAFPRAAAGTVHGFTAVVRAPRHARLEACSGRRARSASRPNPTQA